MSDYRDPELEHMLGRLSGAYPDANTAYVAVTGRVRQVKRRRAFVASTAACVLLFGVGALAARGGGAPQNVQPASESSETSSSTLTSTETSVEDDSTSSSEASSSSVEDSSSSIDPVTSGSAPSVNTGSQTTGNDSSTSSSNTSGSSTSGSSTSDSTKTTAPDSETTYGSSGGSIVVKVTDGALSLVSDAPADGFTTTVKHDRADRVEVEFSDGSTTWRIRVDLVNGVAVVQTTQH